MQLIGYIEPFAPNSFTIPVYGKENRFYTHTLDSNFKIIGFNEIMENNRIFKSYKSERIFKSGDFGALAYVKSDLNVIVNSSDKAIPDIWFEMILSSEGNEYTENEFFNLCNLLKIDLKKLNYSLLPKEQSIKIVNSNKNKITFNNEKLQYSAELTRALAHPLRLKLLEFIDSHGIINVNKIYNSLNLEQSITSQHLRIMRIAGVLNAQRDGKFIRYSINYKVVSKAVNAINNFINSYGRVEDIEYTD